jgi:polar amino acid transport system substrate-binding protein
LQRVAGGTLHAVMTPRSPSAAIVAELAPGGTLRAAINFGNPVLARRDPATGEPGGISTDIARELAQRLGARFECVPYAQAGNVFEGLKSGAWDVCFLAIDPLRAAEIAFTDAYVVIEGVYMVAIESAARTSEEVDRGGTRVGVITGSAYDLFLSRELKQATIVRAANMNAVMDLWAAGGLDAVAGVKPQLAAEGKRVGGLRLLPQRFMAINQAMGTPRNRESGARYLRAFIDDLKATGFVAEAFARNGIAGASLAA